MSETVNLRAIALDILMEINENDQYIHVILNNALKKYQYLSKQDRAFLTRLVQGTVEKQIYLDYILDSYSKVKVSRMKPLIRNLMRLGVYQIVFMDKVPDSAVCNEAVKLANKRGFGTLKGFVNGVLRHIAREVNHLPQSDSLSIQYSMPEWIVKQWENRYGTDITTAILRAFEEPSKTYVRCNLSHKTLEEIIDMLVKQGVHVEKVDGMEGALWISDYDYLAGLDAFEQGLIHVQDISSMLVGQVAAPKPGSQILDVCAAPGGKSIHLALLMNGTGMVDARDISEYKVMMMQESANRLGLSNMTASVADALTLHQEDVESADLVIADLPCSGLGIIGRKADIKYKMTEQKQNDLASLQKEMLSVVSQYVKEGGELIFSTCTINSMENEENYEWIQKELGFTPVDLTGLIPAQYLVDEISRNSAGQGYLQLLPGIHGTDGFFISKFKKEAKA